MTVKLLHEHCGNCTSSREIDKSFLIMAHCKKLVSMCFRGQMACTFWRPTEEYIKSLLDPVCHNCNDFERFSNDLRRHGYCRVRSAVCGGAASNRACFTRSKKVTELLSEYGDNAQPERTIKDYD